MVTITARAKDTLLQLRAQANMDDPELGLRLEADNSILGLFPDRQKPGDQVVEVAGATVLLIADDLADAGGRHRRVPAGRPAPPSARSAKVRMSGAVMSGAASAGGVAPKPP